MTSHLAVTFGLGAVGMAVGVWVWWQLWTDGATDTDTVATKSLVVIPGAALVAYALMAVDVGTVSVSGTPVPVPRYVDWLVTTPVMIAYVGYVAGAPKRSIWVAVAVDLVMISVGWLGVVTTGVFRVAAFTISSLCYVGLLVALYRVFPRAAGRRGDDRRQLFEVLQNHVGLLWLAYPVIWAVGPLGFGYVSAVGVTVIVTFTDVMAKTPYVYFAYHHRSAFGGETAVEAAESDSGRIAPGD